MTYLAVRDDVLNESLVFNLRDGGESASWSIVLICITPRDDELNESLTGFLRGGGESASGWSVVFTYLAVRDDALTH